MNSNIPYANTSYPLTSSSISSVGAGWSGWCFSICYCLGYIINIHIGKLLIVHYLNSSRLLYIIGILRTIMMTHICSSVHRILSMIISIINTLSVWTSYSIVLSSILKSNYMNNNSNRLYSLIKTSIKKLIIIKRKASFSKSNSRASNRK